MHELQIFNNEEFGQVRTVLIDNEPYFVGKDVAVALGYAKPENAISTHVDEEDKTTTLIRGTGSNYKSKAVIISESGLYSLVFGSKLETAKKFKHWVTSDVLPTLRKTGSYETPKKQPDKKKKNLSATNMMVKTISGIFKEAGVSPTFIAAETKRLYKEQAGIDIQIPLITDSTTQSLWDCTTIAKELGIMSESGRPHDKAVSAIIQKIDLFTDEIVRTAYSRNGHDGVTVQYKSSVLEKVREWLEDNGYPSVIELRLTNGNMNRCRVSYQEVA